MLTSYLKDLRVLKQVALTLASACSQPPVLPLSIVRETETLGLQVNSLMREKEIWENSRHGLEIVNLCVRYFQSNEDAYVGYVGRLEELVSTVHEDYGCYLPVEAVITTPVLFCQYYVERVCRECGCCGNNSLSSGQLRKVNFSPVLDKKVVVGITNNQGAAKDPAGKSKFLACEWS